MSHQYCKACRVPSRNVDSGPLEGRGKLELASCSLIWIGGLPAKKGDALFFIHVLWTGNLILMLPFVCLASMRVMARNLGDPIQDCRGGGHGFPHILLAV